MQVKHPLHNLLLRPEELLLLLLLPGVSYKNGFFSFFLLFFTGT
jgi:hypothetical protein